MMTDNDDEVDAGEMNVITSARRLPEGCEVL